MVGASRQHYETEAGTMLDDLWAWSGIHVLMPRRTHTPLYRTCRMIAEISCLISSSAFDTSFLHAWSANVNVPCDTEH